MDGQGERDEGGRTCWSEEEGWTEREGGRGVAIEGQVAAGMDVAAGKKVLRAFGERRKEYEDLWAARW